jgi:hypothetical protein
VQGVQGIFKENAIMSGDSSVSNVTDYWLEECFLFRQRSEYYLFAAESDQLWYPPRFDIFADAVNS